MEYSEFFEVISDSPNMKNISRDFMPSFLYFQIKRCTRINENGIKKHTLQFIDISAKIFYDDVKAQEEFVSLINSTISHEMKNPLNSIVNECIIQNNNIKLFEKNFLNKLISKSNLINQQNLKIINSTISHEIKNPLNSIVNDCIIQNDNIKLLEKNILNK